MLWNLLERSASVHSLTNSRALESCSEPCARSCFVSAPKAQMSSLGNGSRPIFSDAHSGVIHVESIVQSCEACLLVEAADGSTRQIGLSTLLPRRTFAALILPWTSSLECSVFKEVASQLTMYLMPFDWKSAEERASQGSESSVMWLVFFKTRQYLSSWTRISFGQTSQGQFSWANFYALLTRA